MLTHQVQLSGPAVPTTAILYPNPSGPANFLDLLGAASSLLPLLNALQTRIKFHRTLKGSTRDIEKKPSARNLMATLIRKLISLTK
jgi:hypothetical protein